MNPNDNNYRPPTPAAESQSAEQQRLSAVSAAYPQVDGKSQKSPGKLAKDGWRSMFSTLLLFLLAPIIALSIAAFVIQSYQVDGKSMETTLQHNDRLIVDKLPRTWSRLTKHPYIPNRGDIIVFNQEGLPDAATGEKKQLIKRVIGLPGERVVIKEGKITVYNNSNPEGFNPDKSTDYKLVAHGSDAPPETSGDVDVIIPEGQVFVCGDNRPNSEDSRYFGPVDANEIVGKLILRILPLSKAQRF